ncbi:zinc-binding alcohol dehydrogenase family protein [Leptolyngbya cf. ectocarpi LEGE 11479]|uniref:Zinc-type alcohol dehydrogenase-like protein n=1 Tax=Leptolyngbya cf. ectocarpi LEGE 11479 TaxID=1828722 RepID=A0A929F7C1_LEPEC|nr:zinc-binding alcohol dehydrogenase family protein [Leptolyngbya ectocarpi]MBE9068151.1 zinc-binding alcohol dehydrogenase family protein [Leptolyngbya cf. ectocarpi LEGE 11479]
MKAIGYTEAGPISADSALIEFEADSPKPGPNDLLVEVRGVSVNPVDVKLRSKAQPDSGHRILGFDAAGVVKEVGSDVTRFQPGDDVFYAGDVTRPGTNAQFHVVDERIVGRKPSSLGFAEAAGIPLTSITAWEILFDSFGFKEGDGAGESLLVIGGAGGVGSILIQLAKKLTGLSVIATASRDDTREWVAKMGADHIINHRNPLDKEMEALGISPRYVASLTHTASHYGAIQALIKPRGHIALIDDPGSLDVVPLKSKALSLSWEFMFARSMFQTEDMDKQHQLLNRVSELLDDGTLISTVNHHGGILNVENLRAAHELQESGKAIGKTVLDGVAAE